jgi:hypothetical protein
MGVVSRGTVCERAWVLFHMAQCASAHGCFITWHSLVKYAWVVFHMGQCVRMHGWCFTGHSVQVCMVVLSQGTSCKYAWVVFHMAQSS